MPAVLEAWYSGFEAGNALADVLFGAVNRWCLPFTFPVRLEDCSAHPLRREVSRRRAIVYRDGIFVGYRWIEKERIEPLFAFGHGLVIRHSTLPTCRRIARRLQRRAGSGLPT